MSPEISFVNRLENGTRIELGNKYSYNVSYGNNNTCRGQFSIEVADKANPDKFKIKTVVIGMFEIKNDIPKEKIHVETYKELFPYVRALISTVTTNTGIPPVIIPAIDIEGQSIYKFEKNN